MHTVRSLNSLLVVNLKKWFSQAEEEEHTCDHIIKTPSYLREQSYVSTYAVLSAWFLLCLFVLAAAPCSSVTISVRRSVSALDWFRAGQPGCLQ